MHIHDIGDGLCLFNRVMLIEHSIWYWFYSLFVIFLKCSCPSHVCLICVQYLKVECSRISLLKFWLVQDWVILHVNREHTPVQHMFLSCNINHLFFIFNVSRNTRKYITFQAGWPIFMTFWHVNKKWYYNVKS